MILLTPHLRERLIANGRQRDVDHVPVVKFFNPFGDGVWLATELDPDGDIMFGLADMGYPELGSFSLECQSARNVDPLSASNLPPPVDDERLACPALAGVAEGRPSAGDGYLRL